MHDAIVPAGELSSGTLDSLQIAPVNAIVLQKLVVSAKLCSHESVLKVQPAGVPVAASPTTVIPHGASVAAVALQWEILTSVPFATHFEPVTHFKLVPETGVHS